MAKALKEGGERFIRELRYVNLDGLRFRLIDAEGEVLGRLASKLSLVLQGKDKPTYRPGISNGDVVIVTNAGKVTLTGKKIDNKLYRWHTGYVGGLMTRTARQMMEKDPTLVLYKAVERMLPKTTLAKDMLRKLRLFPGDTHTLNDKPIVPLYLIPRKTRGDTDVEMPEGFEPFNPEAYNRRLSLVQRSRVAAAAHISATAAIAARDATYREELDAYMAQRTLRGESRIVTKKD